MPDIKSCSITFLPLRMSKGCVASTMLGDLHSEMCMFQASQYKLELLVHGVLLCKPFNLLRCGLQYPC
jgi:hypothetical protein